jgi:hypothetical protein
MESPELLEIQMAGADARSDGLNRFDNPFLRSSHGPVATGDSFEVWRQKKVAWDRGFCFGYAALAPLLQQSQPGENEPEADAESLTAERGSDNTATPPEAPPT